MDTTNGVEEQLQTEQSKPVEKVVLSPNSYDSDTPKFGTEEGYKAPLRISGVDGTEIGAGKNAEYFRNGLIGIFGGEEADVKIDTVDPFGRNLGNVDVAGVDWRHLLLEVGVSENWGKYGYDDAGTENDEKYKWYAGKTQSSNIEAYELLESGAEPSTIIPDKEFQRIELLRKSLQTHIGDANEGVLDKEQALGVAKELMGSGDLLAAAQKRRWYEMARGSNVAETMLAAWRDPYTQTTIKRQNRTQTLDVKPSVDTSYWAMAKNAYNQQSNESVNAKRIDMGSAIKALPWNEGNTEKDLDLYIQQNDIAPDVAARMYDVFETDGFTAAAQSAGNELIGIETHAQSAAIEKKSGVDYVARMLFNEASPYLTPTSVVAGGAATKIAAQATFAKVASPLLRTMMQTGTVGAATGAAESVVYTASNYKDFSNEELLKTWATDAGFGGAFGAALGAAYRGVRAYGDKQLSKAAGEGIDELKLTISPEDVARRRAERAAKEASVEDKELDALRERDTTWDNELTVKLQGENKTEEEIAKVLKKVAKARDKTRREKGQRTYSDQPSKSTQQAQEDVEFTAREQEAAAFEVEEARVQAVDDEAYRVFADETSDRMQKMQSEIATELQTGVTPKIVTDVDVEAPVFSRKPEPIVEAQVEGKPKTEDVDTRTPEEIEKQEEAWQTESVDIALEHQMDTVQPALKQINDSHNFLSKVHKAIGNSIGMQEFASRLIFNADKKMSYIGTHILESGIGFTGKMKRKASAALIKDSIYTRHVGNLNKSYVDNMKGWAMQGGAGRYKAWKSAYEGGKVNDVTRAFHKEVFKHQEMLQAGKKPEPNEFIEKYIKSLNQVNDELFQGRIAANIKGFDAKRRITNYIPHVWKKVKVGELVKRYGEQPVLDLLVESIESAKRAGKIADNASTEELAKRQLNWINGLGDSMEHTDGVGAGVSGRGKSRIPLDFSVEKNGLSMVDLVDTDIPSLMDSYIQRAGADIGISDATGGLIRSEGDFQKFLTPDGTENQQLVQDAKDMLYGRPTRTGMTPELRNIMDLVTIQQMGGIGVAQLAETGTMAQRLIVNYVSQPKIAKKIWAMAGESISDKGVLHQVRSIAAVNDNIRYINRYSVNNIDQAQIDELSSLRAASLDAVDKVTLGAYKAQFGRMLGALSGVDAVQQAQSRLLQASFSVDIARAAKFNKGTSTVERLNDLGLSQDGAAFNSIRQHTTFDEDGFPSNFNFEKWDKVALDEFVHAMNREEAQLMPRIMAGELPVFMNKPLWQAIMQFRKTPLAFMSKGAQRNLQFADREAVLGTVLNSLTAGITRYSKVALGGGAYVALSESEFQQPTADQMQPWNYVSNFGIMGDAYSVGSSWSKAAQQKEGIEALWEGAKQVSVISAADNAYHAVQGDPSAIKKAMPLNTLPLLNEVSNAVIRNMEQN